MAALGAPVASNTFLALFGTSTLLWRVMNSIGYAEPPRYFWSEVVTEGQRWYDVQVTVAAREDNPQWQGWSVESNGQTPWEGAQVAAFEVLSEICQEFGDELVNGPVGSFPRVNASQTIWAQQGGNALVRDKDERAGSSNAAMSAMYAVMKMFYSCQDSYINCMQELKRVQAA